MSEATTDDLAAQMHALGVAAAAARGQLAMSSTQTRNAALTAAAQSLRARRAQILAANAEDMAAAQARNLGAAMLDRLKLDDKRIESMARGIEDIIALPDPLGSVAAEWTRPNGLRIQRVHLRGKVISRCLTHQIFPSEAR
jgi:glutamate-5-semialdehyde dehydrogenase